MPKLNNNKKKLEEALIDLHLPNMGVLFGLTEDVLALVLVEMGLLHTRSDGIRVTRQGWDDRKAMFGLNPKLEVEMTNLSVSGKRFKCWFVRLGTCSLKPNGIFRNRLPPTLQLGRQAKT
jgi:hypothetical protein